MNENKNKANITTIKVILALFFILRLTQREITHQLWTILNFFLLFYFNNKIEHYQDESLSTFQQFEKNAKKYLHK